MVYELTSSDFADLLAVARRILTEVLADQNELLVQLREAPSAVLTGGPAAGPVDEPNGRAG